MSFTSLFFLLSGGMIGTFFRYFLTKILTSYKVFNIVNMPVAVLIINISGSLLFALFIYFTKYFTLSDNFKLFIFTGFLGSYTTYSTYIFEATTLCFEKEIMLGVLYICLSFFIPFFIMYLSFVKLNA
ncbi:MAG: fluoride efflux transporter CrcB [Rickettsiales bacterium]|nr:fluoride efflux transporter CrcB [Rickettsiales bacterium]